MISKVKLSTISAIITISVVSLMVFIAFVSYQDKETFYVLIPLFLILIFCALFLAPVSIAANEKNIIVKAPLNKLSLPIEDIVSVEIYKPILSPFRTARVRLFASGGFLGYWGIFYDPVIGKFNGYFGNSKSCFLITKKNGDKFVLGCANPHDMVDYIEKLLK